MKDYCIWHVSPPGYVHTQAFNELVISLSSAFRVLGIDAPIVYNFDTMTNYPIIVGCNLISADDFCRLPKTAIIYNLEQITIGSPSCITDSYLDLLRAHEVWDYSRQNMRELAKLGITNVKYCAIGYMPELTRIEPAQCDIDFLWYGSLNERRAVILKRLHEMGYSVEALFGVYGASRDAFIARSKIVLNIHFYESKVIEIGRIYYLLANRRFVISEKGNDRELEDHIRDGLVLTDYENMVEACVRYLKEDKLRQGIAEKGFSIISSFSQPQFLRNVLNC